MDFFAYFSKRCTTAIWGMLAFIIALNTGATTAFLGHDGSWALAIALFGGPVILFGLVTLHNLGEILTKRVENDKKDILRVLLNRMDKDLRIINTLLMMSTIFWFAFVFFLHTGAPGSNFFLSRELPAPHFGDIWLLAIVMGIALLFTLEYKRTYPKLK